MSRHGAFWRSVLEQLVDLPMRGALELSEAPFPLHQLAGMLRSQLGGRWRAYLPGSRYTVRLDAKAVTITRTG